MCGIAGIFNFDRRPIDRNILAQMSNAMRERGPDDHGMHIAEGIGLVHQRLSIIDLTPAGRCPMTNETETLQLVFNGEIYNHDHLRTELKSLGHRFSSHSDTEVIVHGYEEFGEKIVDRLEGMFAFGIWDTLNRCVFLARDRVGEKPLFYIKTDTALVFASTLNALLAYENSPKNLDPSALQCYLSHGFIPASHTIWKGIHVFPHAHRGMCLQDGNFTLERYWDFPEDRPQHVALKDAECCVTSALQNSVKARLVADVPVGVFLSGGVDSSLVAALAAQSSGELNSFSVGFAEQDFSELQYASLVSQHLGTKHHELILTENDLLDVTPELVWQLGQPFGDSSIIPTFLLSRFARQKVKVCLSGDGGDESFAGYWRIAAGWYASVYRRALPQRFRERCVPKISRVIAALGKNPLADRINALNRLSMAPPAMGYTNALTWYNELNDVQGSLTKDGANDHDPVLCRFGAPWKKLSATELQHLLYQDFQVLLPDEYLTKVDAASMSASLEVRTPFLDYRLLESAWLLPDHFKLHWGKSKWLLKRIAARQVPSEVIYRRKGGFALPMKHWWRGKLSSVLKTLMSDSRIVSWGWINKRPILQALEQHRSGSGEHDVRLWLILWLELWARIVVEGSMSRTNSLSDML